VTLQHPANVDAIAMRSKFQDISSIKLFAGFSNDRDGQLHARALPVRVTASRSFANGAPQARATTAR
jgi:hypothetical protein